MNIEKIALEVANELGWSLESSEKFIACCLKKLEEQSGVEPSCWMTPDGEGWRMRTEPPVNDVPLGWTAMYQETQLLAAQQRTADACAKVCDDIADEAWSKGEVQFADRCAAAIRNGYWREYL